MNSDAPDHRGETERWTLHDNGAGEAHLAERRCNYECGLGWKNVEVVPAAAYEEAQKEVERLRRSNDALLMANAIIQKDGIDRNARMEAAEAKIAAMRDALTSHAEFCGPDEHCYFEDKEDVPCIALAALREGTK